MCVTTGVIHRMSSVRMRDLTHRCHMHHRVRASLPDWDSVGYGTPICRRHPPHGAERRNPLTRFNVSCSKQSLLVWQELARSDGGCISL
jgi:hypothetical protein